jgi:hypothetical protein
MRAMPTFDNSSEAITFNQDINLPPLIRIIWVRNLSIPADLGILSFKDIFYVGNLPFEFFGIQNLLPLGPDSA